jgi:hypothetical protein
MISIIFKNNKIARILAIEFLTIFYNKLSP